MDFAFTKLKVAWRIQINSMINAMTGSWGSWEIADAKYKMCLTNKFGGWSGSQTMVRNEAGEESRATVIGDIEPLSQGSWGTRDD